MTIAYDTLTASELLAALGVAGRLPDEDLIRTCLERRTELTPGLLEWLARPDDPDWSFDDPRLMAQVHAALLLIAYREPRALPIFGELYRRPDASENNRHCARWYSIVHLAAVSIVAFRSRCHLQRSNASISSLRSTVVQQPPTTWHLPVRSAIAQGN
jgi:hypothetical protein